MSAVQDFALAAAHQYLQSVVFVDDQIYLPVQGKVEERIDIPMGMSVFKRGSKAKGQPEAQVIEVEVESPPYHPKQLVESFAKKRMVCALYEPPPNFSCDENSELFCLCERADVVILDWDLYGEDGRNVLPLISNLVSQSMTAVPHHVRLIAIYTTKQDLVKVTSQIFDDLNKKNLEAIPLDDLILTVGSTRIVVLGKPTTGRLEEQRQKGEVGEQNLADRIILEFARMHEGILPSMALHGMAAIRMNSKKILDKFHSRLDKAFLVHRSLLLPADDAFDQLPELIAEEVLAVMVDQRVPSATTALMCEEIIDTAGIKLAWATKAGRPAAQPGELAVRVLKSGKAAIIKDFDFSKQKKWVDELHRAMGVVESAERRLAALYNTRTQYGDRKYLTFGTIVRWSDGESDRYAVCLMPLCDSIRLGNQDYRFPFWILRNDNSGNNARGVVIELPEGGVVDLFLMGKPREQLWLETFQASNGTVSAVLENGKNLIKGRSFAVEWLAQLKPSHAQRIAQDIGNSFSRVGLLEAEWLRLKSERAKD